WRRRPRARRSPSTPSCRTAAPRRWSPGSCRPTTPGPARPSTRSQRDCPTSAGCCTATAVTTGWTARRPSPTRVHGD
ncbi:MAG: hypothetical protein AVDCRST_MAG07-681, partial [uncultured Frankineae bacterium]